MRVARQKTRTKRKTAHPTSHRVNDGASAIRLDSGTEATPLVKGLLGPAAWICLALIVLNIVIYVQVRDHEFLNWDDPEYVSSNPSISGGLTWQGISWALTTGHAANWHPLTWISHMLDVQLFGLTAGPHHLTNVVFHIANTILLFVVLFRMTGGLGQSAFVAGLFAAHPLHVESVAWIAERKDVLSTFFWMLTMWAYFAYVRKPQLRRYLLVIGVFALGLMAKPMLVTLPFVLLLLDIWPLRRVRLEPGQQQVWFRLVREKLPLFAMAIASSIVTVIVQRQGGAVSGLDALPLSVRAANAAVSYAAYIGDMVWPARLAVVYPYERPHAGWVIAAVLSLIVVSALAIRGGRRHLYLPVGWLWYLGTLAPVIGLIQVGSQPMADRYTYVPLIGLFIIAAWGIPELLVSFRLPRVMLPIAAVLAIALCSITAHSQIQYWKNNVTLWSRVLAVTSDNSRAHNNLGNALSDIGKRAEAMEHYREALRINPSFGEAHNNMGNALAADGKINEAIESYNAAIRFAPNNTQAHNGLGSALDEQGKFSEAIAQYAEALRLDPALVGAHNNIAVALLKQGKIDDAVREFREAVRLDPGQADFHYNLAVALEQGGHSVEASQELESALKLDPKHQGARRALEDLAGRRKNGAGK